MRCLDRLHVERYSQLSFRYDQLVPIAQYTLVAISGRNSRTGVTSGMSNCFAIALLVDLDEYHGCSMETKTCKSRKLDKYAFSSSESSIEMFVGVGLYTWRDSIGSVTASHMAVYISFSGVSAD